MLLTLTSSDAKSFQVDRQILKHSGTIEDLIADLNLDNPDSEPVSIPLREVNSATLTLVIKWLTLHKDDPVKVADDIQFRRNLSDVDEEFVKGMDLSVLCPLANAAWFLAIKDLREVMTHAMYNKIRYGLL